MCEFPNLLFFNIHPRALKEVAYFSVKVSKVFTYRERVRSLGSLARAEEIFTFPGINHRGKQKRKAIFVKR